MFAFLSRLLDILLPRKTRVVRIDTYSIEDLHIAPSEHEAYGVHITTLMSYRTQAVGDLICALKYDRAEHAARLLSEALAEYLREEIATLKAFSPKPITLIPIPLHNTRLRERGFNQVEVVLGTLPLEFRDGTSSRVVLDALVRIHPTEQQTRLSRTKRFKNVEDAFALKNYAHTANTHVILVDDVTTTGATLVSAARAFRDAAIAPSLCALARASW